MRISELIQRFGGECEGEPSIDIRGVTGVDLAGPGDATFATDEKRLAQAETCQTGCVIVPRAMRGSKKTLIRCDSPQRYAAQLMEFFHPLPKAAPGVHPTAVVGEGTLIDPTAHVGPHAAIGRSCRIAAGAALMASVALGDECEIGEGSILYPNVTLYRCVRIGARVIVHSGAVLGADGFGYFPDGEGLHKWPHVGNVVIEDEVEIGANTCVDRAKFGTTLIQRGAKIDNLVQIGHNCQIGRYCILAGQTGISGSVILGDRVVCGGQAGITDHNTIGHGVSVAAQAGIVNDVPPGTQMFGHPAKAARQAMQEVSMLKWLTENRAELRKLVRQSRGRAE